MDNHSLGIISKVLTGSRDLEFKALGSPLLRPILMDNHTASNSLMANPRWGNLVLHSKPCLLQVIRNKAMGSRVCLNHRSKICPHSLGMRFQDQGNKPMCSKG